MPTKKLVELDEGGFSKEIDPVRLARLANEFKAWLLTIDPYDDPFGFLSEDLPLVEAALNGTLPLPYKGQEPHYWEWHEAILPIEYGRASAPFYNTIRGMSLIINRDSKGYTTGITLIEKDGKRYAWMEFEDPSKNDTV